MGIDNYYRYSLTRKLALILLTVCITGANMQPSAHSVATCDSLSCQHQLTQLPTPTHSVATTNSLSCNHQLTHSPPATHSLATSNSLVNTVSSSSHPSAIEQCSTAPMRRAEAKETYPPYGHLPRPATEA